MTTNCKDEDGDNGKWKMDEEDQRAVFQSELKLILELKLIFPKNEQRLMNTRMIAFDELKLIFNLKMNECNL